MWKPRTQMQTLTRMNMLVIRDAHHLITKDENIKWMKLTNFFWQISINLKAPFCTNIFTSKFLITILNVQSRGKQYLSLLYTMCANAMVRDDHTLPNDSGEVLKNQMKWLAVRCLAVKSCLYWTEKLVRWPRASCDPNRHKKRVWPLCLKWYPFLHSY